jgi:hypothetical protein
MAVFFGVMLRLAVIEYTVLWLRQPTIAACMQIVKIVAAGAYEA